MAVVKEHVLTIPTDMWVAVEDPSPNRRSQSQSKFRVQVEDSHWSCDRTVRELHILLLQTHLEPHSYKETNCN